MPRGVFETNVMLHILALCAEKEFWSDHDKKGRWNQKHNSVTRNILLAMLTV